MVCSEGSLLLILGIESDLMVTRLHIKLGEPCCSMQFINELIHYRKWVFVFHCYVIELPVIYAEPPATIFFS